MDTNSWVKPMILLLLMLFAIGTMMLVFFNSHEPAKKVVSQEEQTLTQAASERLLAEVAVYESQIQEIHTAYKIEGLRFDDYDQADIEKIEALNEKADQAFEKYLDLGEGKQNAPNKDQ